MKNKKTLILTMIFLGLVVLSFYSKGEEKAEELREACRERVPTWYCDNQLEDCNELINFSPDNGLGYEDYPINGEGVGMIQSAYYSGDKQYKSFIRRHTMKLVKYAAGMVACQAKKWPGQGGALGLGDMSESDGTTPKNPVPWVRSPGVKTQLTHPESTHVLGKDIDIAYYQINHSSGNNRLRSVCEHTKVVSQGGRRVHQDQYHCVGEPKKMDKWRTALFLAYLHDANSVRVIGVDGKIGPIVVEAIEQLCQSGHYKGKACAEKYKECLKQYGQGYCRRFKTQKISYATKPDNSGWFRFHHHHLHLSTVADWRPVRNSGLGSVLGSLTLNEMFDRNLFFEEEAENMVCLKPDCSPIMNPVISYDHDYKKQ